MLIQEEKHIFNLYVIVPISTRLIYQKQNKAKQQKCRFERMVKIYTHLKWSKYNIDILDDAGNMVIYNFLTGLTSLTKISCNDIHTFREKFIGNKKIPINSSENTLNCITKNLFDRGILLPEDIDEIVLYYSNCYERIFDNNLFLTILPTGKCNFRCPYCFESPQSFCRDTMTTASQNAIVKFVQKAITKHNALHISWFGGEPLLVPNIIKNMSDKFLRICASRHIPYSAEITTNGYFLDETVFDMLYNVNVYSYIVTLDGLKEQHDKQRYTSDGKGTFDTIVTNLLKIRNNKKYKFANITIRVNMSKGFIETIDEYLRFLASLFADDHRFKFDFVPVVKFAGSSFSNDMLYENHNEVFSVLFKNDVYKNQLYNKELKISPILPQKECPAAIKHSYVIAPDLKIYKCNAHFDFEDNKLGYLSPNGELIINQNVHQRWFFKRNYLIPGKSSCYDCHYFPCCYNLNSGCPVSFLRATPEPVKCPMENKILKKDIAETILYAAKNYTCNEIFL